MYSKLLVNNYMNNDVLVFSIMETLLFNVKLKSLFLEIFAEWNYVTHTCM